MSDTTPSTIDLQSLSRSLDGDAVLPGEETWDSAREAWNLAVDQHPAAVAHAADAADVARVVDFARQHGLRVAVQATGHGAGAMGPLEDTVLLEVSTPETEDVVEAHRVVGADEVVAGPAHACRRCG